MFYELERNGCSIISMLIQQSGDSNRSDKESIYVDVEPKPAM
jgi:hypothetical protein